MASRPRRTRMARTRVSRAFSAGGVVFRLNPDPASAAEAARAPSTDATSPPDAHDPLAAVEIALVGRVHAGMWVLPKGTPHRNERIEETALREVREETGLITHLIAELGRIHYSFSRDGTRFRKEVLHFLLEAVGGDVSLHDSEYDEARWFPVAEAERQLTFANEADLVRRAEPLIRRALADRGRPASASAVGANGAPAAPANATPGGAAE
jgi:8-oxo-dGTP pyrophosphatase MutT (NUDIX family)